MSRVLTGFLSGGIWGGAVSVLTLGALSLVAPQPPGNSPPVPPLVTAPQAESLGPDIIAEAPGLPVSTDDTGAPVSSEPPPVPLISAEAGVPVADTRSADVPQTGSSSELPAVPDVAQAPDSATGPEAPVLPNPQAPAPAEPLREADVVLSTDAGPTPAPVVLVDDAPVLGQTTAGADGPTLSVQPGALPAGDSLPVAGAAPPGPVVAAPDAGADAGQPPPLPQTGGVAAPDAPAAGDGAAVVVVAEAPVLPSPAPMLATGTEVAVAGEALPAADIAVTAAPPAPDLAASPAEALAPEPATLTAEVAATTDSPPPLAAAGDLAVPAAGQDAVVPAAETADPQAEPAEALPASDDASADDGTAIEVAPPPVQNAPDADAPAIVPQPAPVVRSLAGETSTLPQGDATVRIRRPGSAEATTPDAAPTEGSTADVEGTEIAPPEGPALIVHARPMPLTDGRPLMALVLIDDPALPPAVATLASLGLIVTVVIDPQAPDATTRAAVYAEAGYEIAALARLPAGGNATDVAVALEAAFAALPQAVALIDPQGAVLQDGTDAVLARLSRDGRGLVVVAQGLTAITREAAARGVPARVAALDLDAEGQDVPVIRRFLDSAAFRAGQGDATGAVLVARIRPETLQALADWSQGDRAARVMLAPVSGLLGAPPAIAP